MIDPFPSELVASLFEAAADNDLWPQVPTIIARTMGLDRVAITIGRGTPAMDMVWTPAIDDLISIYDPHYESLDPWAARRALFATERVALASEVFPEALLLRSEFYNDYAKKFGMFRPLTADLSIGSGTRVEIGMDQSFANTPLGEADRDRLGQLAPLLRRAIQLRRRIGAVTADARLGLALVEAWAFAAIVCDGLGRVALANTAAQGLDLHRRLHLNRRGLPITLPRQRDTARLHALLADAATGGIGGSLVVEGATPADRLLALVTPLPRALGDHLGLALLTIRGSTDRNWSAHTLKSMFGLSDTQTELALALYDGASLDEIAARRQVKISTLRTHLAQIFERTGTNTQRDLVRLLGQLPPVLLRSNGANTGA